MSARTRSTYGTSTREVETWQSRALCARTNADLFGPAEGERTAARAIREAAAKAICARCEVRLQCLGEALNGDDQWAVLGGATPSERAAMKGRYGDSEVDTERRRRTLMDAISGFTVPHRGSMRKTKEAS